MIMWSEMCQNLSTDDDFMDISFRILCKMLKTEANDVYSMDKISKQNLEANSSLLKILDSFLKNYKSYIETTRFENSIITDLSKT